MLRMSSSGRGDGFKVWAHDIGDPIDDGVAPKLIHSEPTLTPAIVKRFECHVETDLVPELEAIGDRLGRRVDTYLDALNDVGLDALRECFSRKASHAQARVIQARPPRLFGKCNPHL